MVAALYVDPAGIYGSMADVDPWGVERDARCYAGPHPVLAHPPCQRWGRLGTPRPRGVHRKVTGAPQGADGGCFRAALAAVRRWGGVIEHPAGSTAWDAFGLLKPSGMGWQQGLNGEWCAEVWQSAYGHRAPKPTWLYYVGRRPPIAVSTERPDAPGRIETMSKKQREARPPLFAALMVALARRAGER